MLDLDALNGVASVFLLDVDEHDALNHVVANKVCILMDTLEIEEELEMQKLLYQNEKSLDEIFF